MKLALVAGRGDLPALIANVAEVPPLVCGYEGTPVTGVATDVLFRLETLGTLLRDLGARGITHICFAGGLDRPALDPTKLDAETVPLVPLFMQGLQAGDDGALRVVVDLFEKAGFTVIGAHEVAPDLLAQAGVYGTRTPDAQMRRDAEAGAAHILQMSPQDIGQACVVSQGKVIAMEDVRGTDAMIAGLGKVEGGILFKGPKAGQSRQIDLPAVGPETLEAAHCAGLRGVVVDAGDVLVLHRDACVALVDKHDLVFWARAGA